MAAHRRTSHLAGRRGGDPPRDEPGGTKQSGVGGGKGTDFLGSWQWAGQLRLGEAEGLGQGIWRENKAS